MGTSICLIPTSPCHDEIAAYHIMHADSLNAYFIQMNKIVNGKEEEMGRLLFKFNASSRALISSDPKRNTTWTFNINGLAIEGTLFYQGKLYRLIHVKKVN